MKLDPCLTPYTKINLKLINDLNITAKIIKLLDKNLGINLNDFGFGNGFLGMKPKAQGKNRIKGTAWLVNKPRPQ